MGRILLVEDNADDEALTLRAFRKNDMPVSVEIAHDGAEALEHLFSVAEQPRVVLLDINLPKLSGLEVLDRMRKDPRTTLTPVVMLTSSKEEDDLVRSYQLGANSYVRKPVDYNKFVEAIKQLGVYWLALNESVVTRVRAW